MLVMREKHEDISMYVKNVCGKKQPRCNTQISKTALKCRENRQSISSHANLIPKGFATQFTLMKHHAPPPLLQLQHSGKLSFYRVKEDIFPVNDVFVHSSTSQPKQQSGRRRVGGQKGKAEVDMRAEMCWSLRGGADKGERIRGEREVMIIKKTWRKEKEQQSHTHTDFNIYEYLRQDDGKALHTLLKSACMCECVRANTSFSRKEDAAKAKDQP